MPDPSPSTPSPAPPPPAFSGNASRRARRVRWPYVAGAILAALITAGLWPKAVPAEFERVTRGSLQVTIDEEGQTRVKNRFVVASPVAGQLRRIELKPGALVEAGSTALAVLETAGADLLDARSLAQAEARVHAAAAARDQAIALRDRAQAAAALARIELDRAKLLFERNSLSRQELDAATMRESVAAQESRAAEFGLQVSGFEYDQARALLVRGRPDATAESRLTVTSPVSGRVLRVFQESERLVPAGFALLEVGDPADLEAKIEVLSRDGVAIRAGARAWLEKWGGPQPLEARVRLVEPSGFTKISALGVEEQRVNVIVDLVDPLEKRPTLGDAYRVEGRIVVWEGENVLRVPAGALFQRENRWQAYVVDGGRARLRDVKVGHSNGSDTEIVSGLNEGETVWVYPGDRARDGVRVKPLTVK
jgi:HlyD family secretion protein